MPGRFDLLTESERHCLRLALERQGSKDIAPLVGLTHHTVDKRFKSAMRKLGVASRFEAARLLAAHDLPHRPIPVHGRPDQSPDHPDQSPDVERGPFFRFPSIPVEPAGRQAAGEMREVQRPFLVDHASRSFSPALPFRQPDGRGNRLGVWQRIGWMVGLTMLFAMAFGILSTGLLSLETIAETVSYGHKHR